MDDPSQSPRRSPRRPRYSATDAISTEKENWPGSIPNTASIKQLNKARASMPAAMIAPAPATSGRASAVRRVIAPRKSALKMRPQDFPSPSGMAPDPVNRRLSSQTTFISRPSSFQTFGVLAEAANPQPHTAPIAPLPETQSQQAQEEEQEQEQEPAMKRRRVTFSRMQEKTDFKYDEPTMSIRPASEYEPIPADATASTHSARSDDQDDSEEDSDSDSDVEDFYRSRSFTAASEGSDMDIIGGASFTTFAPRFVEDRTMTHMQSADQTRTMEFTVPFNAGGTASSGRRSLGAEEMDMVMDDESGQDTSEETSRGPIRDGDTQSMQLTGVFHGPPEGSSDEGEESYQTVSSGNGNGDEGQLNVAAGPHTQSDEERSMEMTVPIGRPDPLPGGLSVISEEESDMLSRQTIDVDAGKPYSFLPLRQLQQYGSSSSPLRKSFDPSSSGTPSRIRDQLLHGHASPNYKHSPARRLIANGAGIGTAAAGSSPRRSPRKEMMFNPAVRSEIAAAASMQGPHSNDTSLMSTESEYGAAGVVDIEITAQALLDAVEMGFQDQLSTVRPRVARPDNLDELGLGPNVVRWSKAAAGAAILLGNLSKSCQAMEEEVAQNKLQLMEAEKEYNEAPPRYAIDYFSDTGKDQREMAALIKSVKRGLRAESLVTYYGWRLDNEFDEGTLQRLQANKARLEQDAENVRAKSHKLGEELLPQLRERHDQLRADLLAEKEHQAAVAADDQAALKSVHAAIGDQITFLESFRAEHREAVDNLERVQARVDEVLERKRAAEEGIAAARAACEQIKGFTKGEAARLSREMRRVEDAHLWSLVSSSQQELVLVHDYAIDVRFQLGPLSNIQSAAIDSGRCVKDRHGLLAFIAAGLQEEMQYGGAVGEKGTKKSNLKAPAAVRRISQAFSAGRHLLAEVDAISSFFPTELGKVDERALKIVSTVLLLKRKAKLQVSAMCSRETLLDGSAILFQPDAIKVELLYGSVDAPAIEAQIADMIGASPSMRSLAHAVTESLHTFD